jgi:solute carrier family 8 (sodium/calcium exchanger)
MAPVNNSTGSAWNSSDEVKQQHEELLCVDGILLPAWMPLQNVGTGVVAFRGIIYIASLIYLFVGVAILADKFMASIEMITSKKKVVKVKDENGKTQTVVVRVWNETVANLTLMALGCSCPEILLSSIEIIGKGFEAGEMGPGSTVGSAAFNLFVIIGVCNWAIPDGQVMIHFKNYLMTPNNLLMCY